MMDHDEDEWLPEAKVSDASASNEKCKAIARKSKLNIIDWLNLTGIGGGHHERYCIADAGVKFAPWVKSDLEGLPADWQIDMLRENKAATPLIFPCTAERFLNFIDTAPGIHCFSVPDAFRDEVAVQAVIQSEAVIKRINVVLAAHNVKAVRMRLKATRSVYRPSGTRKGKRLLHSSTI